MEKWLKVNSSLTSEKTVQYEQDTFLSFHKLHTLSKPWKQT